MTDRLPIIAAVDGSSGSNAALRYAAWRASTLQRPLSVVHVVPMFLPVAGVGLLGVPYAPQEFEDIGRGIVDDAVAVGQALLPGGTVTGRLTSGSPIVGLVDAARSGYEIVLGADHMPLIARIAIGSAVSGVSAESPIPVIVVPDFWSAHSPDERRIVVGIHDYNHVPQEFVRAAFELARERRCSLEFIHVWELPTKYAEVVDSLMDFPAWQQAVDHRVRAAVAAVHGEYPDIRFSVVAAQGRAVEEIHKHTAKANLLLLAREPHHAPYFGHIGRTLLRTSPCPVEVIPLHAPVPTTADDLIPAGRTA
jgi:nucleotide-binding universal stress UspA family protein